MAGESAKPSSASDPHGGCGRRRLLVCLAAAVLPACSSVPQRAPVAVSESRGPHAPGRSPAADAPDDRPAPSGMPDVLAREVTFLALSLIDTPYRYGGNTPEGGFDCSGLIVYVYREVTGLVLPRTVAQLARSGQVVPASAMRTGDLVLFDTVSRFSHAGIFVGDARFVHAPSTGGTVRLDTIGTPYWRTRFAGVRRI